jgi:transcriptional regulator with XRE-family HTH domain
MITGSQIKMARAALGWSLNELADYANVSEKTIRRLEADQDETNTTIKTLSGIKKALENAGIEFIGSPEDRPGIRIGAPRING